MKHFPRTKLAKDTVSELQGNSLISDAPNGLFLAAPRRTGKSTFLQQDLQPALEAAGVVVVYVDLWSDRRRDPGQMISEAVGRALVPHLGAVARLAKGAGLEKVNVAGTLNIDTSKIGRLDGLTLTEALRALADAAKKPVALIVDEAQHALTSEAGENAMSALKSARDQLNSPGNVRLMLVMSGSDRDKLLRLVNTNGAPFYGSLISRMPMLGDDFIAHVVSLVEAQRPSSAPVDAPTLKEAFKLFGSRPQFFISALGRALNPMADQTERFELSVLNAALEQQKQDEAVMESGFLGLKPIEQAVLWRLVEQGSRFRPYDAEALKFYRQKAGVPVSAQKAQAALEALRQRTPALVWKSARGEYSLDDASMHSWFERRVSEGTWPPSDPQGDLEIEESEDDQLPRER